MKNKATKVFAAIIAVLTTMALLAGCQTGGSNEGKTYKIGATGPLTGGASSYGISVNNGAALAVEEINAAGGLNGVKFSFDMKDDEADPEKVASGYDALFDSGMQISLGSVTSGACNAFGKRAAEDKVFFMTPSASAASVIATGPNAFRVCFGDPDQGVLAAEELVKTYSAIGCIYDTSDDYSAGIYEAFAAKMQELGKAFETRTFDQDNKTDFSSQVEALKGCDAIFLPIYYQEAGLIARACAGKGLTNIVLFGCDGLDGVAGEIDATVTNKISYITPFDVNSTEKNVADFVKNYEKKYNVKPDQFAADGYDAVYAIFNAMKSAGVNDVNIKAADLCAKIIPAITADSFSYTGVTGQMSWDATGACEKAPIIVEVER